MPDYHYRSVDSRGKEVDGVAAASDENSLATLLSGQGLTLLDAELASKAKGGKEGSRNLGEVNEKTYIPRQELIRFTYNFQAIVSAGVPIVKGLESLEEESAQAESLLSPVLEKVITRLKSGESLSKSLEGFPKVFPPLYVNLIAAGESSGNLEPILLDLAEYLEWSEEVRGTIKQATIYPLVIIGAVFGLLALILGFVLPQFTEVFTQLGIELPVSAIILMFLADAFSNYWLHGIIGIVGLVFLIVFGGRTAKGRLIKERIKTRLPLFGPVLIKVYVSRFAKNLAILNDAGIPLTESLEISEKLAENPDLEFAIHDARERVMRGEPLAQALAATNTVPLLVRNMVAIGEESGRLGNSLNKVSQFYDREIKMGLKRAFAILEPAITVVLAAIVGGIALTIISTIYSAITQMGH